jgi:hypothetical protein
VVRARVPQIERERMLPPAVPRLERNTRLRTAERGSSIGTDDKLAGYASARFQNKNYMLGCEGKLFCFTGEPSKRGQAFRASLESSEQITVFHVLAEGLEADFLCRKVRFGRAQQARGVIDDADGAERSRMETAGVPNSKRSERCDGAVQERGRTVIGRRMGPGDERRFHAARGERNRGGETDCTTAYDYGFDTAMGYAGLRRRL